MKTPLRVLPARRPAAPRRRGNQGGMILLFTLVALVVLMVGGVALVRSMDNALLQAGNLAFKRDLANEAERAMARALGLLSTGSLSTDAARQSNALGVNYSASRLASDGNGIPTALLTDTDWSTAGMSGADLADTTTGVTLRYVIDRQCAGTGDITATSCVTVSAVSDSAADDRTRRVNGEARAVYRITVRAMGPRNTLAFFQSTAVR